MNILDQRCLIHEQRVAVARCPACRQFYCRECITEHNERFFCASCLRKSAVTTAEQSSDTRWALVLCGITAGIMAAWAFFYLLGIILAQIPADLHHALILGGGGL